MPDESGIPDGEADYVLLQPGDSLTVQAHQSQPPPGLVASVTQRGAYAIAKRMVLAHSKTKAHAYLDAFEDIAGLKPGTIPRPDKEVSHVKVAYIYHEGHKPTSTEVADEVAEALRQYQATIGSDDELLWYFIP